MFTKFVRSLLGAALLAVAFLAADAPVVAQTQGGPYPVYGSFTATVTGLTATVTGTVQFRVDPVSHTVTLWAPTAITGTSNSTSKTITGLPFGLIPSAASIVPCFWTDNATQVSASCNFAASSGTITMGMGAGFSATGFTNTGTAGIPAGWSVRYSIY